MNQKLSNSDNFGYSKVGITSMEKLKNGIKLVRTQISNSKFGFDKFKSEL